MRSNSVQFVQFVQFNMQFHNRLFCSKYHVVDIYPVIKSAQTSPSSHTKRFLNGSQKDKLNSSKINNNNNTAGQLCFQQERSTSEV